MGFWLFMLAADLLIPATMILFGRAFWKHPPKEINGVYGYRTAMSMKNKDTWKFAHHYCGKRWFWWGIVLVPITIIGLCLTAGQEKEAVEKIGTILCFLQMVPLIGVLIPTERALRKTFDKEGKRKRGETKEEENGKELEEGKWI